MIQLPRLSGRELVKVLGKVGFELIRQHGSHMILRRQDPWAQTVIPDHKELDRGALRAILRQTEFSIQQPNQLLRADKTAQHSTLISLPTSDCQLPTAACIIFAQHSELSTQH